MKPFSVLALSAQVRLTWLSLAAVAASLLGAGGGAGSVVAVAVLEGADSPAPLYAVTRKE